VTTPAVRSKILPARGQYANLLASLDDLLEGEICYAVDEDRYYQKENGVLQATGASNAQGAKADTALQPGSNISELVNDAGYVTAGDSSPFYRTTNEIYPVTDGGNLKLTDINGITHFTALGSGSTVLGSPSIPSSTNLTYRIENSSGHNFYIGHAGNTVNGVAHYLASYGSDLSFVANSTPGAGTEYVRITQDGAVKIGGNDIVNAPDVEVHTDGSVHLNNTLNVGAGGTPMAAIYADGSADLADGAVIVTAAGGVEASSVKLPSSATWVGANVVTELDALVAYHEGTWTCEVSIGSGIPSPSDCHFARIGKMVHCSVTLADSASITQMRWVPYSVAVPGCGEWCVTDGNSVIDHGRVFCKADATYGGVMIFDKTIPVSNGETVCLNWTYRTI